MPKFNVQATVTLTFDYDVETGPAGSDTDYNDLQDPTDVAELHEAVKSDLADDTELDLILADEGYTISKIDVVVVPKT